MKTTAALCAILAGTLGFGSLASAQAWQRDESVFERQMNGDQPGAVPLLPRHESRRLEAAREESRRLDAVREESRRLDATRADNQRREARRQDRQARREAARRNDASRRDRAF